MKKILTLTLTALLATVALATDVNFNFTSRAGITAMGLTYSTSNVTLSSPFTYQDVTFTPQTDRIMISYDDDEEYNFLVMNAATAAMGVQSFKLTAPEGNNITAVTFILDTPTQVNKLGFDSGNWNEVDKEYTSATSYRTVCYWTGETPELTVSTKGAGVVPGGSTQITYRTCIDSFVVTYEEANVTGVDAIDAGKVVKSVRYFNLGGQQSTVPFEGMNIVVTEMADGSKVTTKVMR